MNYENMFYTINEFMSIIYISICKYMNIYIHCFTQSRPKPILNSNLNGCNVCTVHTL